MFKRPIIHSLVFIVVHYMDLSLQNCSLKRGNNCFGQVCKKLDNGENLPKNIAFNKNIHYMFSLKMGVSWSFLGSIFLFIIDPSSFSSIHTFAKNVLFERKHEKTTI